MKVKQVKLKEEFKPITINITFESKEEIYDLYNRARLYNLDVKNSLGESFICPDNDFLSMKLSSVLHKIIYCNS